MDVLLCLISVPLSLLRYQRATVANAHFTSGMCSRQLMAGFRQITEVPQSPSVSNQPLKWSPDISFGDTMGLMFVVEWNVSATVGSVIIVIIIPRPWALQLLNISKLASSLWACWHAGVSVEPHRATSTAVSLWCCFDVLHFSDICKLIEVCLLTHHN